MTQTSRITYTEIVEAVRHRRAQNIEHRKHMIAFWGRVMLDGIDPASDVADSQTKLFLKYIEALVEEWKLLNKC